MLYKRLRKLLERKSLRHLVFSQCISNQQNWFFYATKFVTSQFFSHLGENYEKKVMQINVYIM